MPARLLLALRIALRVPFAWLLVAACLLAEAVLLDLAWYALLPIGLLSAIVVACAFGLLVQQWMRHDKALWSSIAHDR